MTAAPHDDNRETMRRLTRDARARRRAARKSKIRRALAWLTLAALPWIVAGMVRAAALLAGINPDMPAN